MFSDSVLKNLQVFVLVFVYILISFSKACAYTFLSLIILLISATKGSFFIYIFLFFWGIFRGSSSTALFFILVLFFLELRIQGLLCLLLSVSLVSSF